ncbi:MAG TPA: 5-oxoprolinase subunit PxpB [Chloroflexia bacterium]|nr:5-oxoprolinase subunit PxpB [Chloroflexia bacterium]
MTALSPTIQPFGDSALLITFGEVIDVALNARVHALAAAVQTRRNAGDARWGVPVPAYSTLLAPYDAGAATYPIMLADIEKILRTGESGGAPPGGNETVEIAVRYGGADGPDLEEVAATKGLSPAELVALHTGTLYRVFMLGFAPGFAYLGPLPPELITSRRATPRPRVPAGSVAIAGTQTGVYPLATPGGWNLIGRTDAALWDPTHDPPTLLRPGQLVRFVPR